MMLRSLQGLLAVSAIFVLTGAKGQGCGGSETGGSVDPQPAPACEPGTHLDKVCDPTLCDGSCHEECVPDNPCPEGTQPVWSCGGPVPPPGPEPMPAPMPAPYGGDAQGGGGAIPVDGTGQTGGGIAIGEPPPDGCQLVCVPVDPCGPGFHQEPQCDPAILGGGAAPSDANGGAAPSDPTIVPLPPEPCPLVCVPDNVCGPGMHEEWTCDGGPVIQADPSNPPVPAPNCFMTCVPDSQCGPGAHEELVCDPIAQDGQAGPLPPDPSGCYVVCVPDQPPPCPPDTIATKVCDPNADPAAPNVCWVECAPACPPGQHLETGCDGDPPQCTTACVPDDPGPIPLPAEPPAQQ